MTDDHSEAIQQERIDELKSLIKRRSQIEKEMLQTTSRLATAFTQAQRFLGVVVDGRIKDCEEGLEALKALTQQTNHCDAKHQV